MFVYTDMTSTNVVFQCTETLIKLRKRQKKIFMSSGIPDQTLKRTKKVTGQWATPVMHLSDFCVQNTRVKLLDGLSQFVWIGLRMAALSVNAHPHPTPSTGRARYGTGHRVTTQPGRVPAGAHRNQLLIKA